MSALKAKSKRCKRCEKEQPLERFARRGSAHLATCKSCVSQATVKGNITSGRYFRAAKNRTIALTNEALSQSHVPRPVSLRECYFLIKLGLTVAAEMGQVIECVKQKPDGTFEAQVRLTQAF